MINKFKVIEAQYLNAMHGGLRSASIYLAQEHGYLIKELSHAHHKHVVIEQQLKRLSKDDRRFRERVPNCQTCQDLMSELPHYQTKAELKFRLMSIQDYLLFCLSEQAI